MKILNPLAVSLLIASASSAPGAVIFKFGTNGANPDFITGSEAGLNDARNGASGSFTTTAGGGSAGITFDITLAPNIRTIAPQSTGVGVAGGSASSGIDNDSSGAQFQESIAVTISNFSGLGVGETLVISNLRTRFGNNGGETFTIDGGAEMPFSEAASNFDISIANSDSFTIGAGAPPANTRFVIGEITVGVAAIPEPSAVTLIAFGAVAFLRRRR